MFVYFVFKLSFNLTPKISKIIWVSDLAVDDTIAMIKLIIKSTNQYTKEHQPQEKKQDVDEGVKSQSDR